MLIVQKSKNREYGVKKEARKKEQMLFAAKHNRSKVITQKREIKAFSNPQQIEALLMTY